jgi:hypothetical protein
LGATANKTVDVLRIELESTSQIAKFDRLLGDDGKWRAFGSAIYCNDGAFNARRSVTWRR